MNVAKTIVVTATTILAGAALSTPAAAADVSCFSTRGFGLACVDAGGAWKVYDRKSGHLRRNRVNDMALCGGTIYVASGRTVSAFDGDKWGPPNAVPKGSAYRIACAKGGYIVSSSRSIGLWNGSGWKFWASDQILKDEKYKSFNDVGVDAKGTVWFVAFGGIAGRIDSNGAKIWKQGQGFDRRNVFSRLFVTREGQVLIPQFRGLLTPDGDNWKTLAGPGSGSISQGPDGALWLARGTRINRFKDGSWKTMRIAHSARSVAADAKGRIWAATEYGAAVGKDGAWQWRQMHNSDIPDNSLRQVVVLGNGGKFGPPKEQPQGSLKGRLEWRSGDAIAGVTVQICGISKGLFSKSPCADQPHSYSTKTDDDGRFTFPKVDAASYRLVARLGKRWVRIFLSYSRAHVAPGKHANTGTVRISDRFKPKK